MVLILNKIVNEAKNKFSEKKEQYDHIIKGVEKELITEQTHR